VKLSPRYGGPPIVDIDGAPGDPGDQCVPVTRQRRRMESLLAGLSDAEWRSPSRCEGWSIQDVISHLITVNGFWETSVRAGLAGEPTRMLANFDPAAHPPLMVDGMRSLQPSEVLAQFVSSNAGFLDALAALDNEGWSTLAESPAGHVTIRLLAFHAIWDAWIHERDIARPLGQMPAVEADEVRSCLQYAAAVGPALTISEGRQSAAVLAVEATDPDVRFVLEVGGAVAVRSETPPASAPCLRGSTVDLIEALSIRAPLPADAPPEWHQLIGGLATVFDAV
jgi:uncharacterized protein (TIGR03083 family)